jgi:hypothetical protein
MWKLAIYSCVLSFSGTTAGHQTESRLVGKSPTQMIVRSVQEFKECRDISAIRDNSSEWRSVIYRTKRGLQGHLAWRVESDRVPISHLMFWNGEVIYRIASGGEHDFRQLTLVSKVAGRNSEPTVGEIFPTGNFPIAGIIGGYHIDDYFSGEFGRVEQDGFLLYESDSNLGEAQVWMNPEFGNAVWRIRIKKSASDLLYANQPVNSKLRVKNLPETRFASFDYDYQVDRIVIDPVSNERYAKESSLTMVVTSERGMEETVTTRYMVENITFEEIESPEHHFFSKGNNR